MLSNTFIYCLEKKGIPFYVGRSRNPKKRFFNHKIIYGDISMFILQECDELEHFWEAHYIWLMKSFGFVLKNKNIYVFKQQKKQRKKPRIIRGSFIV